MPGGKPPYYTSVKAMQAKIDEYFESCEGEPLTNKEGEVVYNKSGDAVMVGVKIPTITGLALSLGFASRVSLLEYQGKPEYLNTITRAKSRVEEYVESRLYDRDGARGAEFSLKCNFKWRNEAEASERALKVITVEDLTPLSKMINSEEQEKQDENDS